MDILVKAAQFVLSLSLLIIVHEMGHFMFAKFFKCRVEKFYLFFNLGFSLFKTKRGETEYGIGWLPLGGYVKISGMIDESMDKEQMKQPPQPWEFRSKKPYQRLLIMVGGVLMNFITALIIYIGVLYVWGEEFLPTSNVAYGIEANAIGEEIGFRDGDIILTVGNEEVEAFFDVIPHLILEGAESVQVERDGKVVNIPITQHDVAKIMKSQSSVIGLRFPFDMEVMGFGKESPALEAGMQKGDHIVAVNKQEFEFQDQFAQALESLKGQEVLITISRNDELLELPVQLTENGMLGIQWNRNFSKYFEFETKNYGFLESIPAGIAMGYETSVDYLKQFKLIFNRTTKGYESLGGFITIGSIFPGMWNWQVFWKMTAFLSIILGIMNILPIPALDGGHVMFVLYEMISGRKPNEKFLEYAQFVGLSILLLLVLYANANDVIKLFR
ncbi:RIP metalloprotease RseP [Roseimarinus sediminis]|jgi:regulator of sigma E protease|uniref:RIP metalloprotease RseP n=1 Tax=Roseimarinus sediminis TaxID=1610899 RepID=UPI003D2182C7